MGERTLVAKLAVTFKIPLANAFLMAWLSSSMRKRTRSTSGASALPVELF